MSSRRRATRKKTVSRADVAAVGPVFDEDEDKTDFAQDLVANMEELKPKLSKPCLKKYLNYKKECKTFTTRYHKLLEKDPSKLEGEALDKYRRQVAELSVKGNKCRDGRVNFMDQCIPEEYRNEGHAYAVIWTDKQINKVLAKLNKIARTYEQNLRENPPAFEEDEKEIALLSGRFAALARSRSASRSVSRDVFKRTPYQPLTTPTVKRTAKIESAPKVSLLGNIPFDSDFRSILIDVLEFRWD